MAISPKKKTRAQKAPSQSRPHLWLTAVCTVSFILAIYIISEQTDNTNIYMKYIETYGKFPKAKEEENDTSEQKTIKAVSILGERNSGTTWMYEWVMNGKCIDYSFFIVLLKFVLHWSIWHRLFRHLNECFNHTIPVKRRLTRYKHWFQDEGVGEPIDDGTLVLAIFRNPFEWVEAMRKKVRVWRADWWLLWEWLLLTVSAVSNISTTLYCRSHTMHQSTCSSKIGKGLWPKHGPWNALAKI